jgi:hypothetical protein
MILLERLVSGIFKRFLLGQRADHCFPAQYGNGSKIQIPFCNPRLWNAELNRLGQFFFFGNGPEVPKVIRGNVPKIAQVVFSVGYVRAGSKRHRCLGHAVSAWVWQLVKRDFV